MGRAWHNDHYEWFRYQAIQGDKTLLSKGSFGTAYLPFHSICIAYTTGAKCKYS